MHSGAWSHGGLGLILPNDAGSPDWRLERLPVILVAAVSARYAGHCGRGFAGARGSTGFRQRRTFRAMIGKRRGFAPSPLASPARGGRSAASRERGLTSLLRAILRRASQGRTYRRMILRRFPPEADVPPVKGEGTHVAPACHPSTGSRQGRTYRRMILRQAQDERINVTVSGPRG